MVRQFKQGDVSQLTFKAKTYFSDGCNGEDDDKFEEKIKNVH